MSNHVGNPLMDVLRQTDPKLQDSVMDITLRLEDLPIEAIESITKYLSVHDLNNCCAVCVSWHNILGQDVFWKKHCSKNIARQVKSVNCKLDVTGGVIKNDPYLQNMSEWRFNFVLQNLLRRNWKFGYFYKQEIQISNVDFISSEFYKDDILFVFNKTNAGVWDIRESPILLNTIHYNFLDGKKPDCFKIVNDMFVVIQYNLVKVFEHNITTSDWNYSFSFLFDKSEDYLVHIEDVDLNKMVSTNLNHVDTDFLVHGDILIGVVRKIPLLHIWNLQKMKKLKVQEIPVVGNVINLFLVSCMPTSNIILVECCLLSVGINILSTSIISHLYNTSNLEFLPFQIDHYGLSIVSCDFMFILQCKLLSVYNFKTGQKISEISLPSADHHVLSVFEDKAVLSCNSEIQLWDTSSKSICITVPVDFSIDNWIHIWDKFVVTECCRGSVLWCIGNESKHICSFSDQYLSFNRSFTKLLLKSDVKLSLVNFW